MTTLVAIAGDLHTNSTLGVMPPTVRLDDGGEYKASPQQRWLWRHWVKSWAAVGEARDRHDARLVVILNGELADNNHHHTTQLVTRNPADQLNIAIETLRPVTDLLRDGDRVFVTRGTEAHSGPSGHLDETLAQELGATGERADGPASWWRLRAEFEGVRFDVSHHPPGGGGRMPWTRANYAPRLAAMMWWQYVERGERPPHFAVYGHVHRPGDSYDAFGVRALITPSWQLMTSYGYRIGGDPLPVGLAWVVCRDGEVVEVVKKYDTWRLAGWWTEKS